MKTDAAGALRIMEVNGIPGLKPLKSWGPQLCSLYFKSPGGEMDDYRRLVKTVIEAAARRYA
jgi:D-alanine-D-alanine ligase